jgi:hypothetical protein
MEALYNPQMIIALKNPLLIFLCIASVPYVLVGSFISILIPFGNIISEFVVSNWEQFSINKSDIHFLPFTDTNWLPYV